MWSIFVMETSCQISLSWSECKNDTGAVVTTAIVICSYAFFLCFSPSNKIIYYLFYLVSAAG